MSVRVGASTCIGAHPLFSFAFSALNLRFLNVANLSLWRASIARLHFF